MRVMLPYWTNSGNRSWTVTVDSVLLFRYVTNISIYSLTHAILSLCLMMIARVVLNRNVANKVLLSTDTVQDLLPEIVTEK